MNNFNKWLATKITSVVGSMWCAYVFVLIALISLPAVLASNNLDVFITWLTQTFLQLVLISVIIAGQNIQNQKSEARMEKMLEHITQDNDRILKEIKEVLRDEQKILNNNQK